jgi:hypothetical protein
MFSHSFPNFRVVQKVHLTVGGGLMGVEAAITPPELRVVGGGSGTRLGFRGFNLVFLLSFHVFRVGQKVRLAVEGDLVGVEAVMVPPEPWVVGSVGGEGDGRQR